MDKIRFEFAKVTEVTDMAHSLNKEYEENNIQRVFICPDTLCVWIYRLIPDLNKEYEYQKGVFLLERGQVDKQRGLKLNIDQVRSILINDNFDCYDSVQACSIEEIFDILDGGYGCGIINWKFDE